MPIAMMRISTSGRAVVPEFWPVPCRNATSARAKTIAGTDNITLNVPVRKVSMRPPK